MILQRYAAGHHFPNPYFYVDDGYSGASFQRPGFQQMMADMENDEVGITITKDLSRLGRDQLHTGLCIERHFPMFGVHYIAVNDNMDTDSSGSNELMLFKNLFNEWYVWDSSRRVRVVLKAKAERGKRLGARVPYGYKKDGADSKKLVVDREAAAVMRRTFAVCAVSRGPSQITRKLGEKQILCPTTYAYQKFGVNHTSLNMEEPFHWTSSTVANMLGSGLYLGSAISMRFGAKSYRGKHRVEHPKEECLVLEGTHPALMTQEVWNIAQRVRQNRHRPTKMNEQNKYSGLVVCAGCGSAMVLHRVHTMRPTQNNFAYRTYRKEGAEVYAAHYIRECMLNEVVLEGLRRVTAMARKYTMEFAEHIGNRRSAEIQREIRRRERELTAMRKRGAELDAIFKKLYGDWILGHLSVGQFQTLSSDYTEKQERLAEEIPAKEGATQKLWDTVSNTGDFITKAKHYTDIMELTPELLQLFIQKIMVHEKSTKWSKKAMQAIGVRYGDIGFVGRDVP